MCLIVDVALRLFDGLMRCRELWGTAHCNRNLRCQNASDRCGTLVEGPAAAIQIERCHYLGAQFAGSERTPSTPGSVAARTKCGNASPCVGVPL